MSWGIESSKQAITMNARTEIQGNADHQELC